MNLRYWDALSRRYYKIDLWLKIITALMASGTVASWAIWEFQLSFLGMNVNLWKILSSLVAVVSIILPFLNFPKKFETATSLKRKWTIIKNEYLHLWTRHEDDELGNTNPYDKLQEIRELEVETSNLEVSLTRDDNLLSKCAQEVKTIYCSK